MQKNTKYLGNFGEQIAAEYLIKNNFSILEKNWRYKKYEIDIIARKNNIIHIIEVKTRHVSEFGEPEDFVTKAKQKYIVTAANEYIVQKNLNFECEFDIIAIKIMEDKQPHINYLKNAFYPKVN
jgi:putative endonuclease